MSFWRSLSKRLLIPMVWPEKVRDKRRDKKSFGYPRTLIYSIGALFIIYMTYGMSSFPGQTDAVKPYLAAVCHVQLCFTWK